MANKAAARDPLVADVGSDGRYKPAQSSDEEAHLPCNVDNTTINTIAKYCMGPEQIVQQMYSMGPSEALVVQAKYRL